MLFGDVWICSEQSNMEMTVIDTFNGTVEIDNAENYPKMRLFTVARANSASPHEELVETFLNCSLASPQSVGGPSFTYMSAVYWLYDSSSIRWSTYWIDWSELGMDNY